MTVYDNGCVVNTPKGIGEIVDIDTMSQPVITYDVKVGSEEYRYTEHEVELITDPEVLNKQAKMLASEVIGSIFGIRYIYTYQYGNEIYYYSYLIEDGGLKHIKQLKCWVIE